ncbi:MAG: membrane protein insertion efficiency factor YidD [Acetanaerobacterium sp.]
MMQRAALAVIRLYQRSISPLFPARCRYYPTCSAYASGALARFGFVRGGILAAWRILRCNPLSRGGVDYVPARFQDAFKRRKQSPEAGMERNRIKPDGEDC